MLVDPHQPGLVVEHLLEVRDGPGGVDRVAGEAPAQVVVDPAGGHGRQRSLDHGQRTRIPRHPGMVQAQLQKRRLGELGSGTEAAPRGVETAGQLGRGRRQQLGIQRPRVARFLGPAHQVAGHGGAPGDGRHQRVGLPFDLVAALPPGLVDGLEHTTETRGAVRVARREVRAGEEGAAVGGEKERHGPPPASRHGLDGVHVDGVDVRPLLAVDLHGHESGVHRRRRGVVLERLVGHDVAPVARRVAHGQQDGPVLAAGPGERFVAPRIPVDRIVGMLPQIGTGL